MNGKKRTTEIDKATTAKIEKKSTAAATAASPTVIILSLIGSESH